MTFKCADVHRNRVLHETIGRQIFKDATDFGVTLLHRHDLFDVLDVAPELIDFFKKLGVLRDKEFSKLGQIAGQLLSARIFREIIHDIAILRGKECRRFG